MTTPVRIATDVTIPAGESIPATRYVRAYDVTPGMVRVDTSRTDYSTRLAVVTDVRTMGGRIELDSATGGRGSWLPDVWVPVVADADVAARLVADTLTVLERWEHDTQTNLTRYAHLGDSHVAVINERHMRDTARAMRSRLTV